MFDFEFLLWLKVIYSKEYILHKRIHNLTFDLCRYESRLSNSTIVEVCCRQNVNSTDVYLHFENPKTNEILSYNDPVLARHVTSDSSANNIKYAISGGLGVQASDIHPPYEVDKLNKIRINIGKSMSLIKIINRETSSFIAFLSFRRKSLKKWRCKMQKTPVLLDWIQMSYKQVCLEILMVFLLC